MEQVSRDTLLYYCITFLNRKSASTQHHGRAHEPRATSSTIFRLLVALAEWPSQRRERYPDADEQSLSVVTFTCWSWGTQCPRLLGLTVKPEGSDGATDEKNYLSIII